jgi:HEAT repeat protein
MIGMCPIVGCASLPSAWTPFPDQQKLAREQAKYGTTADQRMASMATEAKAAKGGTSQQQAEFTARLAARVLEEHDPRVRARIVETAAGFDTPAAVSICRGGLEDPEPRVRMSALGAWAKRGGPEALQLLSARYQADRDLDVRLRALRELGNLGDGAAIPVLARALEDPDPAVQYRAVAALKKVSGRDLGDDVNKWRAWAADPGDASESWSIAEAFRKLF